MFQDVPSPIDFRTTQDAREWASAAMSRRPWRSEFFVAFTAAIKSACPPNARVLELGSGPGFLARHLLGELPSISYTALDFSGAMHEIAFERLGALSQRAEFAERNLREPNWADGLGPFDAIVTQQAVHELRHKRHAHDLHVRARKLLAPGASYLVCDHFFGEGGMQNDQLYMTVTEQRHALEGAGFGKVEQLLLKGGMVLHRAS